LYGGVCVPEAGPSSAPNLPSTRQYTEYRILHHRLDKMQDFREG
jgi:hypothetical protein